MNAPKAAPKHNLSLVSCNKKIHHQVQATKHMSAFWNKWTENWTGEQLEDHLQQGWTAAKLVDVYEFLKEKNEEVYQTYFLNDLNEFLAQGYYAGNYTLHEYIHPTYSNEWGRKDWTEFPCDPIGFILNFYKLQAHYIGLCGKDQYDSNKFVMDFEVLKKVWRREYIVGYERLGYLTGQKAFLDTIYWNVIRLYLIHTRGYKCQLCGNPGYMAVASVLELHHNHYRVHGIEHRCLDTLLVLHRECHQQFHPEGGSPYIDFK